MEEKELQKDVIIVSPHPDDEIIGCYEILANPDIKPIIIYSGDLDSDRREEALKLKEHTKVKIQLFQMTIPQSLLSQQNTYYFPDPIYEVHPHHRQWGFMGEQLARNGFDVVFYSVNMQAPYIHEVKNPEKKEELLQKAYPSQDSLWIHDKKYVLFEGRCKWVF